MSERARGRLRRGVRGRRFTSRVRSRRFRSRRRVSSLRHRGSGGGGGGGGGGEGDGDGADEGDEARDEGIRERREVGDRDGAMTEERRRRSGGGDAEAAARGGFNVTSQWTGRRSCRREATALPVPLCCMECEGQVASAASRGDTVSHFFSFSRINKKYRHDIHTGAKRSTLGAFDMRCTVRTPRSPPRDSEENPVRLGRG